MPSDGKPFAEGRLRLGLAGRDGLRWAMVDLTSILETYRRRLDLSPVASAALGRAMAGAALLVRMAEKTPTRLMLEVRGDGPLGQVLVEADGEGNLRGLVGNRLVDVPRTPANKLDVGRAVGDGLLRVAREVAGRRYQSQVELVSGEIGDDLAHYLDQSEQTRSAVLVGVLTRQHGIAAAGGLMIEALPEAAPEVVSRLEENLSATVGVSRLLEDGGADQVLGQLLAGLEPRSLDQREVFYRCRCSREKLLGHLSTLSAEEAESLVAESGEIEADCVFCGSQYRFVTAELQSVAN
ncbi:MAG: Hsp33 family molecular chaperone HslO [Acidobacteriota bacterium]